MSITAVKILHARTPEDLQDKINAQLQEVGQWQPNGSPFTLGELCCIEMINGETSINNSAPQVAAYSPQAIAATEGMTLDLQSSGGVFSAFVLTMAAGLNAITISLDNGATFPDGSSPVLMLSSQKAVAAVTFTGNATGGGLANPTALAAGVMYMWGWDSTNSRWMRLQ